MIYVEGRIVSYDPETGEMLIRANYPDFGDVERKEYDKVEIRLDDGRTISAEQRRKAYALEGDIGRWAGYLTKEDKAELHDVLKDYYIEKTKADPFSLSDCSVTEAREFISTLIDFVLENDVPCIEHLLNRAEDVDRYLYACLWHRRCVVCGGHADVHHVTRVGMGRNRKSIVHVGMDAMALCREHHQEAHNKGQHDFDEFYHVYGISIDEMLAKQLGLNYSD